MAMKRAAVALMLAGACLGVGASGVTEADLAADDVCAPGDEECSLSLRQLRGEEAAAEVRAHEEEQEGEEAEAQEDLLFRDTDADGDGEVQHGELSGLLSRLEVRDEEEAKQLFEAEDQDGSAGLDTEEFAGAMAKWATSCSAAHASFFCSGTTQIKCCKRGWAWKQCGSVRSSRSCMHGTTFTSCSSAKRSWYCSGSTRMNCCKKGWMWSSCGSVRGYRSCR